MYCGLLRGPSRGELQALRWEDSGLAPASKMGGHVLEVIPDSRARSVPSLGVWNANFLGCDTHAVLPDP